MIYFFIPSGHHWRVLFTGINKVEFPKASEWHWKQSLCNRGSLRLAVTYQVTQSFWLCKQKSQEVSWHCTFKSRKYIYKKTFNTKISFHNTSCISLCFPVSYAPPLIVFPCENVYSASHSSQPPHTQIKMPFTTLFSVSGFLKVLLILTVCPTVPLESLFTPLGLRSLWTFGSESKCLGIAESIIKLVRWNLWAEY